MQFGIITLADTVLLEHPSNSGTIGGMSGIDLAYPLLTQGMTRERRQGRSQSHRGQPGREEGSGRRPLRGAARPA